jgi:3-hydroxy-3-methylglutaryl CoA synthase
MNHIGIEKLNIYGGSLYLNQEELAKARGLDPAKVVKDFLIDTRSVLPPFEDTITMGANAAAPLLEGEDLDTIGMLIVGTESSVDFGKPVSTNIMGALGLGPRTRNYETKHACYSGVAALDTALNWIASGLNRGKKALIISTDFSRMHLNAKEEFVLGGVSAAALISDNPRIIEYELDRRGAWSTDAYDTFRPSARDEMGNNEVSLYTYMDAIEGAYSHYEDLVGKPFDFGSFFSYLVYHTPFPGMAFQAHRTLTNLGGRKPKPEIVKDFDARVMPGLRFARRVGSTYGASNFVGLAGLIESVPSIRPGTRVGFFAYGSGAIGEFYSGLICPEAYQAISEMKIPPALDKRQEVNVQEYEYLEKERHRTIETRDFAPDFDGIDDLYTQFYEGNHRLVLKDVKNFYRTYGWS